MVTAVKTLIITAAAGSQMHNSVVYTVIVFTPWLERKFISDLFVCLFVCLVIDNKIRLIAIELVVTVNLVQDQNGWKSSVVIRETHDGKSKQKKKKVAKVKSRVQAF